MGSEKKKMHHLTAKTGKPPGMNYADFLRWKQMIYEEAKAAAISEVQRVVADRQAQRISWMYAIVLNERYGYVKRLEDVEQDVKKQVEEYDRLVKEYDQDYADENLRTQVSKIRGHEVHFLYEDQYPVNKDLTAEEFAALRESEGRIY